MNHLLTSRNAGLRTDETDKMIEQYQKHLHNERQNLKRKRQSAERQKQFRRQKKTKLEAAVEENPALAAILKVKSKSGRPRLENEQPGLLETIIDLAVFGSGADDRRRTELIRSCKTLDDLHGQLKKMGFEISRSATYLRLIPRRANSTEGKRHVKTAPVKLTRAQTSEHKRHEDSDFCIATIRALESVASLLGPHDVFFLSQDDKARIPLGITAANKQCSILMHMDYLVILPDHNWMKAEKHKLSPSVYASMGIKENGLGDPSAVTYSGPTFIAVRSCKHSSSDALTHSNDFDRILQSANFEPYCKMDDGSIKPVVMISTDGGPDENPRYNKVINMAVQRFKTYDLDALFIFTNAPGRSAFNRVERRMAPLSHELAGLILPYEHFGSHLSQGKTVDDELEKQNFKYAGEVLCEVWNSLVIDGHNVEAEYIDPEESLPTLIDVDPVWYSHHVRESQYLLQIVKCDSEKCCGVQRSRLKSILPTRFLPPPLKMSSKIDEGLMIHTKINIASGQFAPLFVQLAGKFVHHAPLFKQVRYEWLRGKIR